MVFNKLSRVPFVLPANPCPAPVIPATSAQFQISAIIEGHKREARLFHKFNNTDKALKQQILGTVDDIFTRALKNRYIGYANITTKELLNHLFTTYGKISGNDLRVNDTRMNAPYNVNLPIEVLFNQMEEGMDYADAGNHFKTPEQTVVTGQQLIQDTGMFADNLKIWKRLTAQDRTWTRFKTGFFNISSRVERECGIRPRRICPSQQRITRRRNCECSGEFCNCRCSRQNNCRDTHYNSAESHS